MYPCCEYTLLWSVQFLPLVSLTPLPPTPILYSFQYIPLFPLPLQMFYNIIDALSFSFPFPPSPSSIEWFHYYTHVLHMGLYMIMFSFCVYLSLGSIFHIWEKTCGLCLSEPGLLHLTWYPWIASIYLQTT
jgi:hypothetical protein